MYHIARIAIGTETGDMVCRPYDGLGLGLELGFRAEIRVGNGIIGARTFPPNPGQSHQICESSFARKSSSRAAR